MNAKAAATLQAFLDQKARARAYAELVSSRADLIAYIRTLAPHDAARQFTLLACAKKKS